MHWNPSARPLGALARPVARAAGWWIAVLVIGCVAVTAGPMSVRAEETPAPAAGSPTPIPQPPPPSATQVPLPEPVPPAPTPAPDLPAPTPPAPSAPAATDSTAKSGLPVAPAIAPAVPAGPAAPAAPGGGIPRSQQRIGLEDLGPGLPAAKAKPRKSPPARKIKLDDFKADPKDYIVPPTKIDTSIVLNLKKVENEPERRMSFQFSAGRSEIALEQSVQRVRHFEEFGRTFFQQAASGAFELPWTDEGTNDPTTAPQYRGDFRYKLNSLVTLEGEAGVSGATSFFTQPGFRYDERSNIYEVSTGALFTLPWRVWRFGFYSGASVGYVHGSVESQFYLPSFTGVPRVAVTAANGSTMQFKVKGGGEVFMTKFLSFTFEGEYRSASIDEFTYDEETLTGTGLVIVNLDGQVPIPGTPRGPIIEFLDGVSTRGIDPRTVQPLFLESGEPDPDRFVAYLAEAPYELEDAIEVAPGVTISNLFGLVDNEAVIVPVVNPDRPVKVDFTGVTILAGLRYHF